MTNGDAMETWDEQDGSNITIRISKKESGRAGSSGQILVGDLEDRRECETNENNETDEISFALSSVSYSRILLC
jgi:hypothetical protein